MKKILVVLGIIVLIMPIILIAYITKLEMDKYEPKDNFRVEERAYGELGSIFRQDIEEKIDIKGVVTSRKFEFIDLNNKAMDNVRLNVKESDEIKVGDVLAYVNGREVVSDVKGIVVDIDGMREKGFIRVLNLEELILESYLEDNRKVNIGDIFETEDGLSLELVDLSNISDQLGRKAYFKIEGREFFYGENLELGLYTGIVHTGVLVVSTDAIYQKEFNGPYYLRIVDASGIVSHEEEIRIGYSDKNFTTIDGVEEGWFVDLGYAKFMRLEAEER